MLSAREMPTFQKAVSSVDKSLLDKLIKPHDKFINVDTGRPISLSSAKKKKHVDYNWKFCTDNLDYFRQLQEGLPKKTRNRSKIPSATKHFIWMRDYGNVAEARCFCCGVNVINITSAECGHIVAFSKGGSDQPDNLRMICRSCNRSMGNQNMNEFMRQHGYPIKKSKLAKLFKLII